MTKPALAVARGDLGRYYRHPDTGELYVSVTNVAGSVRDEGSLEALIGWGVKLTAEYWRDHLPAAVAASMSETLLEQFVKESKQQRSHARQSAADLGSFVHACAEAKLLDTQVDLDAFARTHDLSNDEVEAFAQEAPPYVKQYEKFLTDWGVDIREHVEAAECTVASNTHRYAGTLDLVVWLPIDPTTNQYDPKRLHLWIVDVKTSRTKDRKVVYPGGVLQQSAYRWAEEVWTPEGVQPMPGPITGTALLNLRQRGYGFMAVPTDRTAHAAFVGAVAAVRWLHEWLEGPGPQIVEPPVKPTLTVVGGKASKPRKPRTSSRARTDDPLAVATDPTTETDIPF